MSMMGQVLRSLGGGAVQVITSRQDVEVRQVIPNEPTGLAICQSLVALSAASYREALPDSDVWVFTVDDETSHGRERAYVHLRGSDIFMLRTISAIE